MKKCKYCLFILIAVLAITAVLLNLQVTVRQGVDYKVHAVKIPLYLKLLDFYDRHYNYKMLAKSITSGAKTEEEKAMKIFRWTHENIKRLPKGYPVIDDHVWHIIVRGYGAEDQFSDVFATLCNYSGLDASFSVVYSPAGDEWMVLAFVKINGKWRVFDPYHGIYFVDKNGDLEDIKGMKGGGWIARSIGNREIVNYNKFLDNLAYPEDGGLGRPNIQSPIKRFLYEINKWRNPKK